MILQTFYGCQMYFRFQALGELNFESPPLGKYSIEILSGEGKMRSDRTVSPWLPKTPIEESSRKICIKMGSSQAIKMKYTP